MTLRLTPELHARLHAAADRIGLSVNAVVNDALEAAITRIESETAHTEAPRQARSAYADVIERLGGAPE